MAVNTTVNLPDDAVPAKKKADRQAGDPSTLHYDGQTRTGIMHSAQRPATQRVSPVKESYVTLGGHPAE